MTNLKETKIKKIDYFYCYNAKLRKYLDLSGIRWSDKGFNETTNKPYWMFKQTKELSILLRNYKSGKWNTINQTVLLEEKYKL